MLVVLGGGGGEVFVFVVVSPIASSPLSFVSLTQVSSSPPLPNPFTNCLSIPPTLPSCVASAAGIPVAVSRLGGAFISRMSIEVDVGEVHIITSIPR